MAAGSGEGFISMLKGFAFAAFVLFAAVDGAWAADLPLPLCPNASAVMARNPTLRAAFKAAYPKAVERRNGRGRTSGPCLYPYQALSYPENVVLFTLAGAPGQACHGCPAVVSAVFLRKEKRALKPVGFHDDFIETGSSGDLNGIKPARFGTVDGAVIEGGGTFQGHEFSVIEPFLIRDERMKPIGPEGGIPLASSDCGAKEEGEPCREIRGRWRTEERRLHVRYVGRRDDGTKVDAAAIYELRGDRLSLVSGGEIAAEMRGYRP
jgi:hypothetical protein